MQATLATLEKALAESKDAASHYVTNFFVFPQHREAWAKQPWSIVYRAPDLLLWQRHEAGCCRVYFSGDKNALAQALSLWQFDTVAPIAVDILGRDNTELRNIFKHYRFLPYQRLLQLRATLLPCLKRQGDVRTALPHEAGQLLELLNQYFEPCADQLPTHDDVHNAIAQQSILIAGISEVQGFLWYEITGKTATIRYWLVTEPWRKLGLGSLLMARYQDLTKTCSAHTLWVKYDNELALHCYAHYGYTPTALEDDILLYSREEL